MSDNTTPAASSEGTESPAVKVIQRVAVTVVHTLDGDLVTDTVVLKPVALVASERHFKGSVPAVEGTLYAAHWLLTKEGRRELPPFGVWLDECVEAVEEGYTDPIQAPPAAP